MTDLIRVDARHPDGAAIARAADCLRRGGLVAFPTETVYGLGAHALDRSAVGRLFEAKGRPPNDPLIVHVATFGQVANLVTAVPDATGALAARFWPGPLTLVMRRSPVVPEEVTAGLDTVAIRVPSHPVAHALLEASQLPLAAPSANLFSRPSPTRASHVLDDLNGRIDVVLDGGPTYVGLESTVIDLTVEPPTVLRPGAISIEELREVLPAVTLRPTPAVSVASGDVMASPGLLAKHYAPRAPLVLYEGNPASLREALIAGARDALSEDKRVGVLATSEDAAALRHLPVALAGLGPEHDIKQIAGRLYAALRELDAQHVDVILARDIPSDAGLGVALRDRLRRAAGRSVLIK